MTINIPVGELEYRIDDYGEFDRITVNTVHAIATEPGTPELPMITYSYLLPRDQRVHSIKVISSIWEESTGQYYLFPVQKPVSLETLPMFTGPDLLAYNSGEIIPLSPVISYNCGNARGHRILQVQVSPFRYIASERRLWLLKELTIDVDTEYQTPGVAPYRTTGLGQQSTREYLSRIIINKDMIDDPGYMPATVVQENRQDSMPSDFPSLIGPPVDLIVITETEQVEAYETFGEYKKIAGYYTVVKTMDWIRQNYSGHDDAERTRNFIRDAYQYWGVLFILLGGDVPEVPTGMVWIDRTVIFPGLWLPIATDLYFSDLDGSWNADGDDRIGEVSDSLDLYPDVFVGRLPTDDSVDVFNYLAKEDKYYYPDTANYQTRALGFSSNLEQNWPGYPWLIDIMNKLPYYFIKRYLDETYGNLTAEALYDSLHNGFNVVVGVGHGDVNEMVIHYMWPRMFITNFFYDSLRNDPLYPGIMMVVTCYTNPFQGDCMGEHWVMNPFGGGLAYQGPTSSSEGNIHKEYVKAFTGEIFAMPLGDVSLGEAHGLSKIPFIPSAQTNTWFRVHQFSLTLLGDPTLVVWKNHPRLYSSLTIGPETLFVGLDTVVVAVDPGGDPMRFSVVYYKPGEVFIRDSTQTGYLEQVLEVETEGYLYCAVLSDGYIVYRDSLRVIGVSGFCDYRNHVVVDSLGNGNGIVNPGEEISLRVEVGNDGAGMCSNVWARLISCDSMAVITGDSVWYGDVPGGGVVLGNPFIVNFSPYLQDEAGVIFSLELHGSFGSAMDSFQVMCYSAQIKHFGQHSGGNDTVWVTPGVVNVGHCQSDSIFGCIVGTGDSVILLDSVVSFGLVDINTVVSGYDSLVLVGSGIISYDYELRAGGDLLLAHHVVLESYGRVDGLQVSGGNNTINLRWDITGNALGYRVYRSTNGGSFELQNLDLVQNCYYKDWFVLPDMSYRYYVVAFDSSYNIGSGSDTILGYLNPPLEPGWPQVVYDYLFASPNFGDIDPYYPGLEIAVCGWDGCLYAWHHDGTTLGDNNGIIFDSGSDRSWCSPAIADINNDGLTDIIMTVQRGTDNVYALTYTPGDSHAVVMNGWPRTLPGGGIVSSPALADIDEDGDLEIFVISSFPANLYAFHHDGVGVYDPVTGLLAQLFGTHRGGPAIGDMNNDGHLEIVCGGGTESNQLFVFDRFGQNVPPFPAEIEPNQSYCCVLGNIIGDADLEICYYSGDPSNFINVVNAQGALEWQYPMLADYLGLAPALADINDDGNAEVFIGYNDGLDAGLAAFDNRGIPLTGFPILGFDASSPVIADLNNDGIFDVLTGTTEWELQSYSIQGQIVPGFPINLGHSIKSTPAVFDIDGDGQMELMSSCYDFAFHVYQLDSPVYEWPCYQYDPYNSGCYRSGYFPVSEDKRNDRVIIPTLMVFPTPFKCWTVISFNIPFDDKNSSLRIFDVSGRLVRDLTPELKGKKRAGNIMWSGHDDTGRITASGVYFIQLQSGSYCKTRKIIKIR